MQSEGMQEMKRVLRWYYADLGGCQMEADASEKKPEETGTYCFSLKEKEWG